jgi:hypothetical protein
VLHDGVVALHAAALIAIVAGGWWLAPAQAAMIDRSGLGVAADAANPQAPATLALSVDDGWDGDRPRQV